MTIPKILELRFTTLTMNEWFVLSEPKVGTNLGLEQISDIFRVTERYYRRPYCFISDRRNSYSLNPVAYRTALDSNMYVLSIAAICYGDLAKCSSAKIEMMMIGEEKAFGVFKEMELALEWSRSNYVDLLSKSHEPNEYLGTASLLRSKL